MYTLAYALLILALVVSVAAAGRALLLAWSGGARSSAFVERAHVAVTGAFALSSSILLRALLARDYSLDYVASYTDGALDVFYLCAAFWAGQPGSMLFWALAVSVMGSVFALTRSHAATPPATRLWFWVFFFLITAFFATLLAVWSNPFLMTDPAPADGRGMNPLLQNPGMILHPPLLFLGYGGFTVPSCMALAQAVSGEDGPSWHGTTRSFLLTAWCFLTAGILLGAWWAYMELGWGGYWAWDPVENASLIPWLAGTAALHTLVVERSRGKLARVNVLLVSLATVSGFFATYLVRSGVVDSVHAFGQGPVGRPLLVFVCAFLLVAVLVSLRSRSGKGALESPLSREGALCLTAWLFLAAAAVVFAATLWPVFSRLWSDAPVGLDAGFYNRVCLPLGTGLLVLLALCPWLSWTFGTRSRTCLAVSLAAGAAAAAGAWALSYRLPLPLLAQGAAAAVAAGCVLSLVLRGRAGLRAGSAGAHLGVALCALGIAFSGPYRTTADLALNEGQEGRAGEYSVFLKSADTGRGKDYDFLRAVLEVRDASGALVAVLAPEKRAYDKFGGMRFSEVDVSGGFGKEVYASVSGIDRGGAVAVQVNVEPMVNWLWAGGAVLSLLPLLNLRRGARRRRA